jgi:hypothetical protein
VPFLPILQTSDGPEISTLNLPRLNKLNFSRMFLQSHPNTAANTSQHQPGKLVGNDAIPTFETEVLPAGSAPASKTFQPNPDLNNQKMYQDASSTITGATSSDVHTGLGHPGQGQTSNELRHANKKGGGGLAGLAHGVEQGNVRDLKDDPRHADQRNLGDVPTGERGNTGGPSAQEREPETAERVAADATKQR